MRNFVICTAAVWGMVMVGATQVEAGNKYASHHNSRYGNQNGYGFNRGHSTYQNQNRYSWRAGYITTRYGGHTTGYGSHNLYRNTPVYHNTSNFDYHGPSLQQHGNHLEVVPGHTDFHRSGHYDF